MAKALVFKFDFSVTTPGDFSAGILKAPWGYRVFGACGWQFTPDATVTSPVISITANGPNGTVGGGTGVNIPDKVYFIGTVDQTGFFTLFVPLVAIEDVEFTY